MTYIDLDEINGFKDMSIEQSELYFDYSEALDDMDLDTVKKYIKDGLVIPSKDDNHRGADIGPLDLSIILGDFEFVRELIEKYNVYSTDCIEVALVYGKYDILYYFFTLAETVEEYKKQIEDVENSRFPKEIQFQKERYDKLKNL